MLCVQYLQFLMCLTDMLKQLKINSIFLRYKSIDKYLFQFMGKQKKNKDKKDKKKTKDRDRERERQKKDKKKRDKKRSYSSSSSSSDSSDDSSSSSREKNRKKQSKIKKKDKKQTKTETKTTNNPYDFDKSVSKSVPGFPVGLPTPGFNVPVMNLTPPPPMAASTASTIKPKTKEINIFKILPKLPYGAVLFGKTLYSTQFIQEKAYNRLLKEMMEQVQAKVKEENSKKGMSIISKCEAQISKIISAEEQRKRNQLSNQSPHKAFLSQRELGGQQNKRFSDLKKIYEQCFSA